jgi:hydrogenase-4 component F
VAGVFMARQRDYKRMLAYSSVEHMGILVLGVGIGGLGVFGALLHLVNNAVTKGVLFLSAGNIHRAYGSKSVEDVRGALRRLPFSGALFLAGFFAVTGSPPFAPFLSEFTIVRAAMTSGHAAVGALFLVMLAVVFIGMGGVVLSVVQGDAPEPVAPHDGFRDRFATVAPIALLMGVVVLLGVYVPGPVSRLVQNAATFVEVRP